MMFQKAKNNRKLKSVLFISLSIFVGASLLLSIWILLDEPVYADMGGDYLFIGEDAYESQDLAFGDWDGDGDLDLAVGNYGQPNQVFENEGDGTFGTLPAWESTGDNSATLSVAWGDWDGDGDLDLAVGNESELNQIYENEGGMLSTAPVWVSADALETHKVAWGDWNGDGFLDLAVANYRASDQLFENSGGSFSVMPIGNAGSSNRSEDLAWGDLDNDGDLDIVVASQVPNWVQIYENQGGNSWTTVDIGYITNKNRLDLGDWDGDGDLDLAISQLALTQVWENDGGIIEQDIFGQGTAWAENNGGKAVEWGDWDGDGDLDLAVGVDGSGGGVPEYRIFDNIEHLGSPLLSLAWEFHSPGPDVTAIAFGDVDGDGDLDLAGTHEGWFNHLHFNKGGSLSSDKYILEMNAPGINVWGRSIDLGDWDNDGDLDLIAGNIPNSNGTDGENEIWENVGGDFTRVWMTTDKLDSHSVMWGDWDGDARLDLAEGNVGAVNKIYRNVGGSLTVSWTSSFISDTYGIAWADWDKDGQLDLAEGNSNDHNVIYQNIGNDFVPLWVSPDAKDTRSIDWGDIDNDGDPDLAVGNYGQVNQVFENRGTDFVLLWESTNYANNTTALAWGDWDGDGDLDLGVGNEDEVNQVFENLGGNLSSLPAWHSVGATNRTNDVAWIDWDGDGDQDFAVANSPLNDATDRVYQNVNGTLHDTPEWEYYVDGKTYSIAWGDWNGDGDVDLFKGLQGEEQIYDNPRQGNSGLANNPLAIRADYPVPVGAAISYVPLVTLDDPVIPITLTLFDDENDPVGRLDVFYSPNGGGEWFPATATPATSLTNLSTSPYPTATVANTHVYEFDTLASNFFGFSDNMVVRFMAYPQTQASAPLRYVNSTGGNFQRPYATATTLPFRIQGTQIRVLSDTVASTVPVADARVFRLLAGEAAGASFVSSSSGSPLVTDLNGYLAGRGQIGLQDQLIAALPIRQTETYIQYALSAIPTATGLDAYTVTASGIQTLTVSANNILTLFDLDISLEWDVRGDAAYLAQLEADVQEASRRLFDISNGQAALGEVRVFHNREAWLTADVVIHASNTMRPNADLGGSVTQPLVVASSNGGEEESYLPGQVRMGATWNRNGDPGGTLGVDWPRALAHELAHYFFFLPDNYLGLDSNDRLIPTDCQGSVMTDAYRNDYSELLTTTEWAAGVDNPCLDTVAEKSTGRSDWETVEKFYPLLDDSGGNIGPSSLPLAVTTVTFVEPTTPIDTLQDPYLNIVAPDGSTLPLPFSNVQAYQFETNGTPNDTKDDRIIPLGVPVGALLQTRGAGEGDWVCIYDNNHSPRRIGCNPSLASGNQTVEMETVDDNWQPNITVSPVIPNGGGESDPLPQLMVTVEVSQTAVSGNLQVQVFPVSPFTHTIDMVAPTISLTLGSGMTNTYTATVPLEDAVFEGHVQVWDDGIADRKKSDVASFSFGGGWGPNRYGWGPNRYGWGPNRYGWGPNRYGWGVTRLGWNAPIMSGNGQVTLFDIDHMFGDTLPYTLQSLPSIPNLSSWLTPVGEAYRVGSSGTFSPTTSILFSYLQRNVPNENYEDALQVYYLPEGGNEWQALDTALDTAINQASALLSGQGSYVLAMTVELPAFNEGWNNFGYPVRTTLPVAEALASIEGKYTKIYHYNSQLSEPWQVYDTTVLKSFAPLVNNLENLEFGKGYWLRATEVVIGYLPVDKREAGLQTAASFQLPPATFYGWVVPTADFTPTVGMVITAEIDGNLCGQTVVESWNGQLAYAMQVHAETVAVFDDPNGCGENGRKIVFKVDGQPMAQTRWWNNDQAWLHSLGQTTPEMAVAPLVTAGVGEITLAWIHSSQNSGGYEVWRSPTPYFAPESNESTLAGEVAAPMSAFIDPVANENTNSYYYLIKARNGVSEVFTAEIGRFVFTIQPGQ